MVVKTLIDSTKKVVERANQAADRYFRREEEFVRRSKRFDDCAPAHNTVPTAPLILRIEVTNLCNANCTFCIYQYQQRDIETMSFDVYKKAVDQFTALGGSHISFTPVVGDSLIDKGLEEKVAYARQFPQYKTIEIWTNAILLTRKRFEALVDAGINEFNISMSGFNAAEYKELFRNSNYAKVTQNFAEILQSESFKKVKVVVWSRTGLVAPELEPDFIKFRDLGLPVLTQREMVSWHGQIKESDLPGTMFIMKGPPDQKKPCFHLWAGFTVMSNGDMTVCGCTDMDGAGLPLGNISDHDIDAHLKDGRWQKLRDGFTSGCPPEFCKGCDMYWPIDMCDPPPISAPVRAAAEPAEA